MQTEIKRVEEQRAHMNGQTTQVEGAPIEAARRLKALANEYMAWAQRQDAEARAWAEKWTAEVWKPWAGWLVRYTAVGGGASAPVQEVLVAGEIDWLVRQSPGAQVQVIDQRGAVSELVMGAFLDATPREFETPTTTTALKYHEFVSAVTLNAFYYVNIPPLTPVEEQERVEQFELPDFMTWIEFLRERLGDEAVAHGWWLTLPDVLEQSAEELAEDAWVRRMAAIGREGQPCAA